MHPFTDDYQIGFVDVPGHERFVKNMLAGVGGIEELVGGPGTPSKVTVSFDLGSREAVDELVERAGAAGGRIGDIDDYPFMYQRQFDDPEGYHYSPFWMKPDVDPTT